MKTRKENKNRIFKAITFMLVIIAFSSCSNDKVAAPRTTSNQIITVPFFVENANKQMATSEDELLYEVRNHEPVIAPDGTHLTWGDFSRVTGDVVVDCVPGGVSVTLNLKGLIPNGIYTIWNVTFEAPGMDPTQELLGLDGIGAAGNGDGTDNYFTALADGSASIATVTPGGQLSMKGAIEACPLTGNFEWHIVGTYHIDGKTYGPDLGPDGTVAEQFAFIFKSDNSQ